MHTNYKTPPLKFRPIFAEVLELLTKKNPEVRNCNYPEVRAGLRSRVEGESSTPEPQDPTDGSYIIDTESCNI